MGASNYTFAQELGAPAQVRRHFPAPTADAPKPLQRVARAEGDQG
jgi:hypothetical protein